jgi:hypothetical protein
LEALIVFPDHHPDGLSSERGFAETRWPYDGAVVASRKPA